VCIALIVFLSNVTIIITGDDDHPQYVEPPVIPGHEFFGEVVKLGKGFKKLIHL